MVTGTDTAIRITRSFNKGIFSILSSGGYPFRLINFFNYIKQYKEEGKYKGANEKTDGAKNNNPAQEAEKGCERVEHGPSAHQQGPYKIVYQADNKDPPEQQGNGAYIIPLNQEYNRCREPDKKGPEYWKDSQ